MEPKLTEEQEILVSEEIGDIFHFQADEYAAKLGITAPWSEDDAERIWAAIEEDCRSSIIERLFSTEIGPLFHQLQAD